MSCRVRMASASGNNEGIIASNLLLLGPKTVTSMGARNIASVARASPHWRRVKRVGGAYCWIAIAALLRGARIVPMLYRLDVGSFGGFLRSQFRSEFAGVAPPSA